MTGSLGPESESEHVSIRVTCMHAPDAGVYRRVGGNESVSSFKFGASCAKI